MPLAQRPAASLFAAALLLASAALPSVTPAADLLEVYRLAQANDASYQIARYQLDAARQAAPQARSALGPQVGLSAEVGLSENNDDGRGSLRSDSVGISLTQPLYDRGARRDVQRADLTVSRAEADFSAAGQDLMLRVAERYFAVLHAQDSLQFARSEKEAIARQLDQAERRFEVGLIAVTDVKEAQAQYDLAVAREITAENTLASAREVLHLTTGEPVGELAPLREDSPLPPPVPEDIDAWVQTAQNNSLALRAARLAAREAAQVVEISRSGRYPNLDLVASYAKVDSENPFSDGEGGSLSLRLSYSLYNAGSVDSQVARALANARVADEQAELQRRRAVQQARDAYLSLLADISRAGALKQALISTQVAAEATQAGFEVGTRTAVEVLAALRNTYRAQADYLGSRYDYLLDRLRLLQAAGTLGGGDLAKIDNWLQP